MNGGYICIYWWFSINSQLKENSHTIWEALKAIKRWVKSRDVCLVNELINNPI